MSDKLATASPEAAAEARDQASEYDSVFAPTDLTLDDGDVIDSMFMSKKALCDFYEEQMQDAYQTGVMFSLHVKATMMKVSHPIVFGHCVKIFYKQAFDKHAKLFDDLGVNVNNGMVDLYNKIADLPQSQQDEIRADLHACHEHRPELAMVDSAKGITNFHSPNDIIVDASMPAMIRNGGKILGDGWRAGRHGRWVRRLRRRQPLSGACRAGRSGDRRQPVFLR